MTEHLAQFGYTRREAIFLRLAVLLSGWFLRHHFNRFIHRECGALAQRFIERAIKLGHLESVEGIGGRIIYHASGNALYDALGDPENRNRREHRSRTIRRRLMALDFALSAPENRWLLTAREKANFFDSLGFAETDLPGATYNGKYCIFPERQPIAVSDEGIPVFAFIDEGLRTLSHWRIFLRQHREFLNRVGKATVVFATSQPWRTAGAEALFRQQLVGETSEGAIDLRRLTEFFVSRKLFDERRYELFDQTRIDQLREDKQVFAGKEFEDLYIRWRDSNQAPKVASRNERIALRLVTLPNFYEWLSPIRPSDTVSVRRLRTF